MTVQHRLVTKQLAKATAASGEVDSALLCELMSTCYGEMERDRKRVDRANKLMQEELTQLTGDMERLIEELRVQNLHFQAALDNMSQGLCLLDGEGCLTVANLRFLQIYGLPAEAGMPGCSMARVLGQSPALDSAQKFLELTSTRRNGTLNQKLKDGRIISIVHEPLQNGGSVATFADITERTRLENQLQQGQKLESIGQLAAGIAHEINTPIQYVGDSVEFLRSAVRSIDEVLLEYREASRVMPGSDATQTMLARVNAAEERVELEFLHVEIPRAFERTVDGIARVAKIVRAMKEFAFPNNQEHGYADINHALETTLIVARNEFKDVARVETQLGELPEVKCNISELNQVFLNLIINAAHAIHDSGKDVATGVITVRTAAVNGTVEIAISDNGCGIAPENANKVFDPFFTTKSVGRGTGQGLSIAHACVVTRHRGTLSLETEVNRGTTFFVRVPIEDINESGSEFQREAICA